MFKLVSLFAAARLAAATTYTLEDSYTSSNFMDEFDFFTGPDPTFGNVTYQAADAAVSAGLAGTSNGAIYLGADHTNTYPSGGRPSTRVSSKKTYTKMLLIADLSHMPVGCGTWPALWSFGPSWPSNGEIDIIEGVNDQASDEITLHTSEGCTMTQGTTLAGTTLTGADCGAGNGNDGCPQTTTGSNNYGVNLNSIGGGVSAMEWTSSTISIWWFARGTDIANQLSGSSNGTSTVDVSTFGTPTAQFVGGSGCDIDSNFAEHQIIIDTTFCGSCKFSLPPSPPPRKKNE